MTSDASLAGIFLSVDQHFVEVAFRVVVAVEPHFQLDAVQSRLLFLGSRAQTCLRRSFQCSVPVVTRMGRFDVTLTQQSVPHFRLRRESRTRGASTRPTRSERYIGKKKYPNNGSRSTLPARCPAEVERRMRNGRTPGQSLKVTVGWQQVWVRRNQSSKKEPVCYAPSNEKKKQI